MPARMRARSLRTASEILRLSAFRRHRAEFPAFTYFVDTCPQPGPYTCGGLEWVTHNVVVAPNEFDTVPPPVPAAEAVRAAQVPRRRRGVGVVRLVQG